MSENFSANNEDLPSLLADSEMGAAEEMAPSGTGVSAGVASEPVDAELHKNAIWKRVHPLTPLADSWAIIAAVILVVANQFQNKQFWKMLEDLGKTGRLTLPVLLFVVAIVLLFLLILACSYLEWRVTQYSVTNQAVLFRKGLIFKKERHMRLNRIQAVDVVAPLLPRLLGLGKLHVDSAGSSGSEIDIAYLKISQCQELRAEVLAKAAGAKQQKNSTTKNRTTVTKSLDIAGAGIVGNLPAADGQAPEIPLYEISTDMLFASIIRSFHFWISVAVLLVMLACAVLPAVIEVIDAKTSLSAVSIAFPGIIGVIVILAAIVRSVLLTLNEGWSFTAAMSPDGIRLRHGLTTHDSQTIPPGRIHAIVLEQPLLWRKKDWWKVELTMAGYQGNDKAKKKTSSHVLLPVGSRREALQALWMVERNLGTVTDLDGTEIGTAGTDLLDTMMYGSGSAPGLFTPPRRDRWLDWITWNRKAAVLTTTMMMIRDGRITHCVSFVPHSRMQSVAIEQGPLERCLKLANVRLHLVPGVVPAVVYHLEESQAEKLWEIQVHHADLARDKEPPAEWMKRVVEAYAK